MGWSGYDGPLTKYVKIRVAHAPGMPGTFSPSPRVSDPNMHHGTRVMHVPWCMSGSLTSGFLWNRWREKRSRHSRRMRNPQFYVSGKRPIDSTAVPNLGLCSSLFISRITCVNDVALKIRRLPSGVPLTRLPLATISQTLVPKGPIDNNPASV